MTGGRSIQPDEDPVCGVRLEGSGARANLVLTDGDVEYAFCGDRCRSEFRDDPAWFLDPAYAPTVTEAGR